MTPVRAVRNAGGILVLLVMLVFAIFLIPPYLQSWKLQRYVNSVAEDPASAAMSPDAIRGEILDQARRLNLPVKPDNVQVMRPQNALKIQILYIVHVDFAGYAVDLHFRPAAGGS